MIRLASIAELSSSPMSDATFTYESISEILREAGRFTLLEKIQSAGAPLEIAHRYFDLHKDAYQKRWRHRPQRARWPRRASDFCITQAAADESAGAATTAKSPKAWPTTVARHSPGRAGAKRSCADRRANAGWVTKLPNPTFGLAVELQKPPDKVLGKWAHWLLGAHLLAAAEPRAALAEFEQAIPPDVSDPDRGLFEGYALLARCMLDEAGAEEKWDKLLGAMKENGNDEAIFAREQLRTAKRYFDSQTPPDA